MGSVYTRFLSGSQGTRLSELWSGGDKFVVRRAPAAAAADYNPLGDSGEFTSLDEPPAKYEAPPARHLPAMPEIGRPESYYAGFIQTAEQLGDEHLRAAAKVGQYITLALDPTLSWEEKLKFFRHALKRHCEPPPYPDDELWVFYRNLSELVRQHCGQEALRLASTEDDLFARRMKLGQSLHKLEDDAERFFLTLMCPGAECPDWFKTEDWAQLKLLRDQWV